MKKFMNDPANLTAEMLEGLALAYADKVKIVNERIVVRTTPKAEDKVALRTLFSKPFFNIIDCFL